MTVKAKVGELARLIQNLMRDTRAPGLVYGLS